MSRQEAAQKFEAARAEKGWSKTVLADRSKLSISSISNLTRGIKSAGQGAFNTLAICLGVSFRYDDLKEN